MKYQHPNQSTCPHACPDALPRGKGNFANKFVRNSVRLESEVKGALRSNLEAGVRPAVASESPTSGEPIQLLVDVQDVPVAETSVARWLAEIVHSYLSRDGGYVVNFRGARIDHGTDAWVKLDVHTKLKDTRTDVEQFLNRTVHDAGMVGPIRVYELLPGREKSSAVSGA